MCHAVLLDDDTGEVATKISDVLKKIDQPFICDFYNNFEEVMSHMINVLTIC